MYFIFQKIIQYIFYMLNIAQYIGDYNSIQFIFLAILPTCRVSL